MRASSMPIEHFEMVPLDQFVVTERNHKALPQIEWGVYYKERNYPYYESDWDLKIVHASKKEKPADAEIIFDASDTADGWTLVWDLD